jgi:hypothetical protein
MMIDPVGFKYMVKGNKIDKVEAGPKPGKTPTRVPKTHPIKQYNKLRGLSTLIIPLIRSILNLPLLGVKIYLKNIPLGNTILQYCIKMI